jgi:hypothetical protein
MVAKFAAEWTPEVTRARRETWNALVAANTSSGRVNHVNLSHAAARLGWDYGDLRKAVALNNM